MEYYVGLDVSLKQTASARHEGGREAPALGAGRALPGVTPRAGNPGGQPQQTAVISICRY